MSESNEQAATAIRVRAAEMAAARRMIEQYPESAAERICAHYARVATTATAALHIIRANRGRCIPEPDPSKELIDHCLAVIREDYAHAIGAEPAWPPALLPEIEQ